MNDKFDELAKGVAQPCQLGHEGRLTGTTFDIETANNPGGGGYFLGDYEGLAAVGNDFLATWSQPHDMDLDSIFFWRVEAVR